MGALKEYKPNIEDQDAVKDFLKEHHISKPLGEILSLVINSQDPLFFFVGAAEFSTQEAADILNVSRPFLIDLLEKGEIVFRKIGKHRRISALSLMKYKSKLEEENKKILDELTLLAQKHNLGY